MCAGAVLAATLACILDLGQTPVWLRIVSAVPCTLLAVVGLVTTLIHQKYYHLDISGAGQIRLRKMDPSREAITGNAASQGGEGSLATLMSGTTLWPHFLMLRLRLDSGKIHNVPVMTDSLPKESFRALSVACRWIAAHSLALEDEI